MVFYAQMSTLKGIAHPKMKSFNHPHVSPDFLSSVEDTLKSVGDQNVLVTIDFHCTKKKSEQIMSEF